MTTHFSNLFIATKTKWESVTTCVLNSVTIEQNTMLLVAGEEKEFKEALFNMHPDKLPGSDCMSLVFY